jgi:pimeloyl-ACP methyl ester carboxylesterase
VIREAELNVGDRRIHYYEAGAGWPVVLLHAFPLSAAMWRPQLERVLDALEIERATIGGLSMGGYITFALYRKAPERFLGIVLANTRPQGDTPEGREGRMKMRQLVADRGVGAVADQMLPKLLGETSRRERRHLEGQVRALIEANTAEGVAAAIESMMQRADSTPLLPTIGRPALIIAGDEDTLIPTSDAETMNTSIPRSHLVVLERAGHLSNLEMPEEFSAALANFLQSNL